MNVVGLHRPLRSMPAFLGVVARVAEWGEMRRALRLRNVPHHSTLCYAERRLLTDAERGGPSAPLSS